MPTSIVEMESGAPAQRRGSAAQPGEIGGYEIVSPLGRGGMGVVYRARDPLTGHGVAVKTVLWSGEGALAAIRREILALSAIRHPGVVQVLAAGIHEGRPWYAMELIDGESLRQRFGQMWQPIAAAGAHTTVEATGGSGRDHPGSLDVTVSGSDAAGPVQSVLGTVVRRRVHDTEPGPFANGTCVNPNIAVPEELRELLELVVAMCEPLAHVHAAGIVHRDLTPDNVIVRDGNTPVLVDFGLASSFRRGGREALAVGGTIVGTTHYMAPEQIRGELVDARADLYSLGCILYEALTGRPPFLGASPSGVLAMHLYEPPVPPSMREPSIPLWLNSLVLGLLAKDARARIGYAGDVAAIVRRALGPLGSGIAEVQAPPYVYRARMIGRGGEVQRFEGILGRMRDGRGGAVLVRGESGVGKTRLAVELATRASSEGMRVVVADCPPVVGEERSPSRAAPLAPLKPLLQAVADRCLDQGAAETARLLGGRGRVLATYEPAIGRLPGVGDEPAPPALTVEGTRARLFQYLRETLEALSETGPVVLLIDDVQWADELTLRFFLSLRPAWFAEHAVLIMCTQRAEAPGALTDELAALVTTELFELPRLDEAGIHAMVADMLALPDVPPALVASLVGPSLGVPFHAGEYLRAAVEDGILVRRPGTPWTLAGDTSDVLPTSLAELLRHRLDRLGATGRTLAALAAVVGREFDAELLAELTSMPAAEIDDTLRDMVRRHIFEEAAGGKLRFGHDQIREVAYDGLEAGERRAAHRDAARALEHRVSTEPSHDLYPVLAHHYSMADEPARAIEFLEKAGERALEVGGYQDAIDFLRRALTLTERGSAVDRARRGRWKRWLGEASWGLGDLDGCGAYFSAALDDLDRPLPTTRMGWLRDAGRRAAGQVARVALGRSAPDGDHEAGEAALAVARITYHYFHRGENLAMLASTLRAVDLADRADREARVSHVYNQLAYVAGMVGYGRAAEHYFGVAERRAAATGDAASLAVSTYLQAIHWFNIGQPGRALRLAEDSVGRLRRIGHNHELEVAISTLAHIEHSLGRHGEALAHCQELYESARARSNGMHESWGAYTCAREHIALGHLDDAMLLLDHARELAVAAGDRASLILMGGLRALAEVRRGARADDGAGALDAWLGLVVGTLPIVYTFGHGYAAAAEASLRLLEAAPGDAAARRRARAAVGHLWRYAVMFPVGRTTALVSEARAQRLLGRTGVAGRLARAALGRARRQTLPYDEGLALRELAALDPIGGPIGGEDHATVADAVFARLGRVD